MNQLSLFDTPPAAHPRAARPDLPLLILASHDHIVGTRPAAPVPGALFAHADNVGATASNAQPNDHGIYPYDDAERLILPVQRKNWQGCPTGEICLLQLPQGWLASYSYQVENGGGSHGLSPKWHGDRFLASRADAMDYARGAILRACRDLDTREANRLRDWARSLI